MKEKEFTIKEKRLLREALDCHKCLLYGTGATKEQIKKIMEKLDASKKEIKKIMDKLR